MAKQRKISSWPIKFFRVILTTILESGELELPIPLVKREGKNLSKYACLKVPTGEETKMELNMSEGRAWLHKGWQEFLGMMSSGKLKTADARERVLEKANSFQSPYPHFIIIMTPTYVSGGSYLVGVTTLCIRLNNILSNMSQ